MDYNARIKKEKKSKEKSKEKSLRNDSQNKQDKKDRSRLDIVVSAMEEMVIQLQNHEKKIKKLEDLVETLQDNNDHLKTELITALKQISALQKLQGDVDILHDQMHHTSKHVDSLNYMAQSENDMQNWMLEESVKDATDFKMTKDDLAKGIEKYKSQRAKYTYKVS